VAQHAINNIIEPIFDRRFYYHSYACRAGKGTHAASAQVKQWLRNLSFKDKPLYALKADIHNYFASIDHGRLKQVLCRVIKDNDTLRLLDLIIDSGSETERGIPVGNLTSQLFANIFLDILDKFIKETLHTKYYIRYMDDFLILSHDKRELQEILRTIKEFLFAELGLLLNPKTTIINCKQGIDFCGYRHFKDYTKVRKRSVRNMHRVIEAWKHEKIGIARFVQSAQSWFGHIGHADTYMLRRRIIQCMKSDPKSDP
jgi:retron-type reverse transcriptase